MNRADPSHVIRSVAILLFVAFATTPVKSWDERADEGKAAPAKDSAPAATLEELAARLKKIDGVDVALRTSRTGSLFESRREIAVKSRKWDNAFLTYFVIPSLPADKIGERPADFAGALAVEVIAA